MASKVKGLTIGIIVLSLVLGSVVFLLREPLSSEVSQTILPWGTCLEKYDILRDVGIYTNNAGRMSEYQLEIFYEFAKQHCNYYVYSWLPEHYPERNNVGALYHEYRTDLSEEQKQNLIDGGHWPDEYGVFSVKEKLNPIEENIVPEVDTVVITEEFGMLGSAHEHASMLVRLFGDKLDFSHSAYQVKDSLIHFEDQDGNTIHRHASGVPLGYMFDTVGMGLNKDCFVFPDNRKFCNNDDYTLRFYVNRQLVSDISDYVIVEGDRILISYGSNPEEIVELKDRVKKLEEKSSE